MINQVILRLLVNPFQLRCDHLYKEDNLWIGLVQLIRVPKFAIPFLILIDAPVNERMQDYQIRIGFINHNAVFHLTKRQLPLVDLQISKAALKIISDCLLFYDLLHHSFVKSGVALEEGIELCVLEDVLDASYLQ